MEPGRLRAALIAGKIRVTDQVLANLDAELARIKRGYHIEKLISEKVKTDSELEKDLSRLRAACRTIVEILDSDMSGAGQIEVMLSDPGSGSQAPRLVEELRWLSARLELMLTMARQDGAIKKRQQNPETWFLVEVYGLFSRLTGSPKPGIAGRLHRFTKNCAELIDPRIIVPDSENSFQKRLTAALVRTVSDRVDPTR